MYCGAKPIHLGLERVCMAAILRGAFCANGSGRWGSRYMNSIRLVLAFATITLAVRSAQAAETSITLATTSAVESSGLLTALLPPFTASTGISVKIIAQPTARALDIARRGDADVVLVEDAAAEREFIDEGYGIARRQVAWNDFVLVGPSDDPAHVDGGSDVVAALKAIALARAPFVSRGDRSDVNLEELRLWRLTGRTSEALTPEKWYRAVGGGMDQALGAASANGAYVLADRASWLGFGDKGALVVAVEGDARLLSRYDVIELNPKKHGKPRLVEAKVFADWLASADGQQAIAVYSVRGETPFHASAASPR
jgi:tungstate transport system substrate-binding protein